MCFGFEIPSEHYGNRTLLDKRAPSDKSSFSLESGGIHSNVLDMLLPPNVDM